MSVLSTAYKIACQAHLEQTDKLGVPYVDHVGWVATGLGSFGDDELTAAAWLHDVLEDTDLTGEDLLRAGITERTVRIVEAVTNQPGQSYLEKIAGITDPCAVLVKISDNAHNSRPDRLAGLDEETRKRLVVKYRKARKILWPRAGKGAVLRIVRIVNPDLLEQVEDEFRQPWE